MIRQLEKERAINGILLLNKPQGLSSNAALQQVKRLFQAKKAGHTGSLDPLATGMLPICFGEATKFCQYLLEADKCYEANAVLGIKTNTADADGEITYVSPEFSISKQQLLSVLAEFKGQIKQIPSMFSALKYQGKPLYKYARQGVNLAREAREVTIAQLVLTQFNGKQFAIRVVSSKGTYIRNLVEDIGERLRVGAHVSQLHRLYTAGFVGETMYSLEDLQNHSMEQLLAYLLPMERAVSYLPVIVLQEAEISALRQGKILANKEDLMSLLLEPGCVRLHDEAANFIGLGEWQPPGTLTVRRLLSYLT